MRLILSYYRQQCASRFQTCPGRKATNKAVSTSEDSRQRCQLPSGVRAEILKPRNQTGLDIGVASYGALGHVSPIDLTNDLFVKVHFTAGRIAVWHRHCAVVSPNICLLYYFVSFCMRQIIFTQLCLLVFKLFLVLWRYSHSPSKPQDWQYIYVCVSVSIYYIICIYLLCNID